ncbi:MAG: helix-hairpin-helix domain-containing protein [Bryobacterales bacterium]|nr:helix-hairpin-helix domain-containing protein [Bryobacterales bacterium]
MVVWEDGRMKKSDYRKFLIQTVAGNDDFASMHEVVTRRYRRLLEEEKPLPGLILIDGGLGQLHAAADALDKLGIINQPLASIAKREEIIYVYGQESEPIQLGRSDPCWMPHPTVRRRQGASASRLGFMARRQKSRMVSELSEIPGIGPKTAAKLLKHYGSAERVRNATESDLLQVAGRAVARRLIGQFNDPAAPE